MPLLEVKGLDVRFQTRKGVVRAVRDVSFSLERGKTLAIVGESGSGKSVTAMSILRLLDENGRIANGEILFENGGKIIDLTKLSDKETCKIRGDRISVIFQEPMTALNPVFTIEKQLSEPFLIHRGLSKKEGGIESKKMLLAVHIPNPKRVLKAYPHQLSGGMRQRVMIAMALACRPDILIADEPTTALDVTIQAQILQLMQELQKERNTAILFITHDLGVVNEMADSVAVMYCGEVVERAPVPDIFQSPKYSHPYTEGLLAAAPSRAKKGGKLEVISGNVPHPLQLPKGCKFAPRCRYCTEKCIGEEPPLSSVLEGQSVRCFYPEKEERQSEKHAKLIVRYPS